MRLTDPSFDSMSSSIKEMHLSGSVKREVEETRESERGVSRGERFESIVNNCQKRIISAIEPKSRRSE